MHHECWEQGSADKNLIHFSKHVVIDYAGEKFNLGLKVWNYQVHLTANKSCHKIIFEDSCNKDEGDFSRGGPKFWQLNHCIGGSNKIDQRPNQAHIMQGLCMRNLLISFWIFQRPLAETKIMMRVQSMIATILFLYTFLIRQQPNHVVITTPQKWQSLCKPATIHYTGKIFHFIANDWQWVVTTMLSYLPLLTFVTTLLVQSKLAPYTCIMISW